MGTKVKKWLKTVLCGAGLLALLVLSGMIGIHIERNHQKALELQKEHVSTIAVVNMDNGVRVGNEQVNYASQLMSFPNDHFLVTGLTDAKAGIENGTYAAYVVIPETFSESVTSIENDPQKVILIYQYNNKLVEEAEIQAVNDINAFIALLNSNIAYMYMDAIMAEFHRIQDDSSTILANDNMELELLASVNAEKLIAVAEPVEEIPVNNEIQPVELATYTTRNDVLLDYLLLSYAEASQRAKEDFAAIQEENSEVEMAADNFLLTYDTVIQDTTAEQSRLLVEGRDKLAEAVGLSNQDVDAQEAELRKVIVNIINVQLEADRNSAENQLQEIIDDIRGDNGTLKNPQQQWETAYQDLQLKVDEMLLQKSEAYRDNMEELVEDVYIQGYNNALDDLSRQIDSFKDDADSENIAVSVLQEAIKGSKLSGSLPPEAEAYVENFKAVVRERLSGISIDWSQFGTKFPESAGSVSGGDGKVDGNYTISLTAINDEEAINSMVRETLDLFKMESESEEISDVIQTYFVAALSEEGERQMGRLSEAKLLLSQSMESYEERLLNYDPLQYIESANLGTYLNDIEVNAGEMLDTVEQNNSDYMLYAAEMYTNTTVHTTQVWSSLDEANTQTAENVMGCINDLILSREVVNSQNVGMLERFTNSLNYTRVGSQGNAEVYDYIINPVVSQISGQAVTNTAEPVVTKGNSVKIWMIVVLGIGIILCLTEVIFNFRQQYKKSAEESEDIF
ncbi:MAG: hypothetical protein HDQ99_03460 [Lachnospiraceae bacterium]|nr:hypothetical protein [Lachnospiraceae bacterium]